MFKFFKNLFKPNKNKTFIKMNIEKLFFDPLLNQYIFILKNSNSKIPYNLFINIENIDDENFALNYFHNNIIKRILNNIKIKIKQLNLFKKVNSPDAGECIIKYGLINKKIKLTLLDILYLSIEYKMEINIPFELIQSEHRNITINENINEGKNIVFLSKFIEKDIYLNKNNEVIM